MKKLLLTITVIAVSIITLQAQSKQTDREKDKLIGAVKSVEEAHYNGVEKFGEVVTDKKSYVVTTEYSKDGKTTSFEFNDVEDKEKTIRTYKYNGKNLLVEEKVVDEGETSITRAIYDANDRIIESNEYDKKGNLLGKVKNRYDNESRLLQSDLYNSDGSLRLSEIYEYDFFLGDGVWKRRVDKKLKKEEHWVYELGNKDDKPLKEVTFEGEATKTGTQEIGEFSMSFIVPKDRVKTSLKKIAYTYNDKGWLVKEETRTEKNYIQSTPQVRVYEYDKYGNKTLEKDSDRYYTTFTYTYDAKGNWIKKVEMRHSYGNIYHYISERKIKYY